MLQRENPNRLNRPPPPYCYHPELFPELAPNNPKPFIYKWIKKRRPELVKKSDEPVLLFDIMKN